MDLTSLLLGFVVGAALGAVAAWLLAPARAAASLVAAQARLEEARKRIAQLEAELRQRDQAIIEAQREAAALTTQVTQLEQAETRLRGEFARLAADALDKNSASFLQLAEAQLARLQERATSDLDGRQKAIGDLVRPLRESLDRVDTKLQEVDKARVGTQSALDEQLHALAATTRNLERALRTPHVRGRWGELQLRRVVELAGMLEHCDFEVQPGVTTDEGRLVPDLKVQLPGGRNVVVDAKVPLEAYLNAFDTSDEAAREGHLKEHARQVRDHITKLSQKGYWDQFAPAPEFVFMFLPGENFLSAALQHDPALIEFGVTKRVIPAGPLTLIALLRAVAYGWQQERLAENAQTISALGRELYERIRKLADHFEDLAKGLRKAVDAYNSAVGTLESRVLVSARKFRDLSVSTPDELPELERIDQAPRTLQAPEFADLFGSELVEGETIGDKDQDRGTRTED